MSRVAVTQSVSSPSTAPAGDGRWLLEVRAHRTKLIGWFALWAVSTPFVLAMSAALIALLVSAIMQMIGRGDIFGVIACALLLLVIGSMVGACLWITLRGTLGLWRCLRHRGSVVRADDNGVEMFNLHARRWDRLAWEDVGVVGVINEQSVAIEHSDPVAWEARQPWLKRRQARLSRRLNGMSIAIGFWMPMEESASAVVRKLAALRDVKHQGHVVAAAV